MKWPLPRFSAVTCADSPETGKTSTTESGSGDARYKAFRGTFRFASLDGLRCLSIVGVVWHHGPGHQMGGPLGSGFLGVDLFFVISGFLITTLLLREQDRYGSISLKHFYIRRSLRIFPLYYTVLGLYVLLLSVFGTHTPPSRRFFANLPYF
jgi:peptidoglycan/LPS O-acetylase OafA/YrhL